MVLLGVPPLSAQGDPSLRIDKPEDNKTAIPPSDRSILYDPYADLRHNRQNDDELLRNPFYEPDTVRAALSHLPRDLQLGPMDIPDYAEQDRLAKRADYAIAIGRIPRHHATIFGMSCDLTSPLSFTCKDPTTDCVVGLGFPPVLFCPF